MQGSIPHARRRLIRRIAALTRGVPASAARALLSALAPRYLHGIAEDELAGRPSAHWLAMLRTHFEWARRRPRGRELVRIFNPEVHHDGFDSPHTLVLVVTDDRPFLVDSITMVFAADGAGVHLVVHPVLGVDRDTAGRIRGFVDLPSSGRRVRAESWQLYEIDRIADPMRIEALRQRLLRTLRDVRAATADWRAITARATAAATQLESGAPRASRAEAREAAALLRWMVADHFTFLGYREYRIVRRGRSKTLVPLPETGLGVLRPRDDGRPAPAPLVLTGAVLRFVRSPAPILISKGNELSNVHRATYPDYIGVKILDTRGRAVGEHRFIGLWTSAAYHSSPRAIPLLRRKVEQLLRNFGLDPASHDGKAVLNVIEEHPRDELFQATAAELMTTVRGIVNLYERARTRLFLRRDAFGRFCSCLVYLPRDRYSTEVRLRVVELIRAAVDGLQATSQVQLSESATARLHVLVRTDPARPVRVSAAQLERRVATATHGWHDDLRAALLARHEEAAALQLLEQYGPLFPASYRADVPATEAVEDIAALQALRSDAVVPGVRLVCRGTGPRARLSFRLFRHGTAIRVSDVLPMIENLGFRLVSEDSHALAGGDDTVWLQDFVVESSVAARVEMSQDAARLADAFAAVWRGDADDDGFNRLVLAAGLDWRLAAVLRACARWLVQLGLPFSQRYLEDTLVTHATATRALAARFVAQFEPLPRGQRRDRLVARHRVAFQRQLAQVARQDEDRILRALHHAIDATVRTNHFQRDAAGAPQPWLALKIETRRVPEAPLPRPLCEIFVHAPRVEGVHLRMGRVARGGLRWSERREDFRTEVLGLMKAQNVKNTLIVPVGAKGGFVPRRPPATREGIQRDGVESYRIFVRALLGLTDNIVDGRIVPPPGVVRLDGDDPYLVVAADKGTAAFSDLANAISLECGYWLGDAFASGGTAGYDHKRMGITARGAWECVKRHFRELGLDAARQDFTVAGIGDMSGDVFGNGMLQSRHMRLVAAFNHQHIFIDPDPDAARSFVERRRLFRLARGWDDYDRQLLSRGGGIFDRHAKSLTLAPEARRLLGLESAGAAPQEVIRRILCLPVDLLWNGGIGTYVKATGESHADVGDRVNDMVRVDGARLRARVVGEGGNLGFSQAGRIEYARHGGCINTDFIDNSGGVNCSDLEVNIKIALDTALRRRRLTRSARDRLLARMAPDVTTLVLRNNYLQSQAISLLEAAAPERFDEFAHLITLLERSAGLDRRLAGLPDEEELTERRRQGAGFTRPEIATLLCWSRIWLKERLLQSDVPEDVYLGRELVRYFPAPMRRRFAGEIAHHRLRREIIATATTSSLVNRMGPAFVPRAVEDSGAPAGAVARACTIAREVTQMRRLWAAIEARDGLLPAAQQYAMMQRTTGVLAQLSYWFLERRGAALDIEQGVAAFGPGLRRFLALAPALVRGIDAERLMAATRELCSGGVPERLAATVAALSLARSGIDVVDISTTLRVPVPHTARLYLELGTATGLDWLRQQIDALPVERHLQVLARGALREEACALQRRLCEQVLRHSAGLGAAVALAQWRHRHRDALEALARSQAPMRAAPSDFPTLSVALAVARRLASG